MSDHLTPVRLAGTMIAKVRMLVRTGRVTTVGRRAVEFAICWLPWAIMTGMGLECIGPEPAKVDFCRDVRPILAAHCFKCHGQDEATRKAKLRLDVRAEALKPAEPDDVAIVPSQPDKSELVRRIFSADEDDLMPPPAANKPLTVQQKDILKRWIAEGAEYQPHWAFVAPTQSPPPKVRDTSWPKNAIDSFVLARLEQERLEPAAPADKYSLVRRLCLDLTGLPPTPAQTDAFVHDTTPTAYEWTFALFGQVRADASTCRAVERVMSKCLVPPSCVCASCCRSGLRTTSSRARSSDPRAHADAHS